MAGLVLSFTTMYRPNIYRLSVSSVHSLPPDVNTAIHALDAHRKAYKMSDVFIYKFLITQPFIFFFLCFADRAASQYIYLSN